MTDARARRLVELKPDYVAIRRFGFSFKRLEAKYPDGTCPDHIIAQALGLDGPAAVAARYDLIVQTLRADMGAEEPT